MELTKSDIIRLLETNETPSITELEQLADIILSGQHILITKINFAQINAKPAAASITFNYPGAKDKKHNVLAFVIVLLQKFVSPTRDLADVNVIISSPNFLINQSIPMPTINQYDTAIADINFGASLNKDQDVSVDFDFNGGGNNPQDYSQGEIAIYFRTNNFPPFI